MMDPVSGGAKPITDLLKATSSAETQKARAATPKPELRSMPMPEAGVGGLVREMAEAPPVDLGKVESLRAQIASGAYKVEPDKIAAAMIRAEKGG